LLVQHDLAEWSFDESFIRRVERVAEELAWHAVVTTGITKAAPLFAEVFDDLQLIVVRLRAVKERVMVEVWDRGNALPAPSLATKPAIAAAVDWGYDIPLPNRRVVWCVLAAEVLLPQPAPRPTERPTSAKPGFDTGFLHRVLDGVSRYEPTDRFDGDQPAP
jgi:hypothetical protein